MRESKQSERGSAIVEAALTLVTFLMVTMGLIMLGCMLYVEQRLTHGARDAARYGVVHAYEDDATLKPEVRNLALCGNTGTCDGAFGLTTADVTVTCAPSGATCKKADRMVVSIAAHGFTSFVPGLGGLSARAITVSLPIENTGGPVD